MCNGDVPPNHAIAAKVLLGSKSLQKAIGTADTDGEIFVLYAGIMEMLTDYVDVSGDKEVDALVTQIYDVINPFLFPYGLDVEDM